jgi:hypothetical protein
MDLGRVHVLPGFLGKIAIPKQVFLQRGSAIYPRIPEFRLSTAYINILCLKTNRPIWHKFLG